VCRFGDRRADCGGGAGEDVRYTFERIVWAERVRYRKRKGLISGERVR
jgi:hypothetical protein